MTVQRSSSSLEYKYEESDDESGHAQSAPASTTHSHVHTSAAPTTQSPPLVSPPGDTLSASTLLAPQHPRLAARLSSCGRVEANRLCTCCGQTEAVRRFCGYPRLCATCSLIRATAVANEVAGAVRLIGRRPIYGYSYRHLILSVPPQNDARQDARHLITAFATLHRHLLKGEGTACLRTIEFGRSGNPHVHALHRGPYVPFQDLADAWGSLVGRGMTFVRGVKDTECEVADVVKYIFKFPCHGPQRLVELWEALRGLHLVQRYGLFRRDVLDRWLGRQVEDQSTEPLCDNCGARDWVVQPAMRVT